MGNREKTLFEGARKPGWPASVLEKNLQMNGMEDVECVSIKGQNLRLSSDQF